MNINEILDMLVDKCSYIDSYDIYNDCGNITLHEIHKCCCSNCDGHLSSLMISINNIKNFNDTTIFILKKWIKKQKWTEW